MIVILMLATGCSRAKRTTTQQEAIVTTPVQYNPSASLRMVNPTTGSVTENQAVTWQVVPTGFSPEVVEFNLVHATLNLDVSFGRGGYGEFSRQYATLTTGRTETVTVEGRDATGLLVSRVTATSPSFAVVAAGSNTGSNLDFNCSATVNNQNATIPVNQAGTPLALSSQVGFSLLCSKSAELMSISSQFGSFSPTNGGGVVSVSGRFSRAGSHQVVFAFRDLTSNQTAQAVTNLMVSANQIITPSCTITGTASARIAVNSQGVPVARSEVVTYVITANKPYEFGRVGGGGDFQVIDNVAGANLTRTVRGTFGAVGAHQISVEIKDEFNTVASCGTATNLQPLAPPPAPLTCGVSGSNGSSIRYDQYGNPYQRSGEVAFVVTSNRPAGTAAVSQDGGFGLHYAAETGAATVLYKGTFSVAGVHTVTFTMSDKANGNLRANCSIAVNVNRINPAIQPVWRGFSGPLRNHMQSLNSADASAGSFNLEGVGFNTYVEPTPACGIQLFRCITRTNARRFVSGDGNCEGHIREASLGYVCAGQAPGTGLLRRIVSTRGKLDHLTTRSDQEITSATAGGAYRIEGPQGYAP